MKKIYIFIIVYIYWFNGLEASYLSNIELLKFKRTKQYNLKEYSHILVCTPYRTGSTLLYNILRFLFENENILNSPATYLFPGKKLNDNIIVYKSHSYPQELKSTIVISSIRNPVDACFSYLMLKSFQNNEASIQRITETYVSQLRDLEKFQDKYEDLVILNFEEFNDDFNFLLKKIENIFSIEINEKDKELIKSLFSKNNISRYIISNNIGTYDKHTLFNRNHIYNDRISIEIEQKIKDKFYNSLKNYQEYLNKWGYFID